jgi:glycosyltransferase involved in cell wall biosynthesis
MDRSQTRPHESSRYSRKIAPGACPRQIAVMIGGLGLGGSERQLYLFLAHCNRERWSPALYVSGELGGWENPIRELGVPIMLLKGNRLSKAWRLRSAVSAQGATCFFSWSSYTNGFGLALTDIVSRRIGSFRNADFSDLPERMRQAWRWTSLRGVSLAVCNSRETQAAIARAARLKSVYIPNAVEMFPYERVQAHRRHWRALLGLDDDTVLVVGVGCLAPQKGFCRFVEAMAQAARQHPVQAVIAGADRGCKAALEAQVARLRMQERVRLIGPVADARELICAADIYLLSSNYEGMPNVVLEAMAAGVACVATKVNGVGDLIRPGVTGLLAEPVASDLARRVSALAADPALRREMGARGRALVEHEYQPEQIIPRLWALCDECALARIEVGLTHGAPASSLL